MYKYRITVFMALGLLLALACVAPGEEEPKDTSPPNKLINEYITNGIGLVPNNYNKGSKLILAFNEPVTMVNWRESDGESHRVVHYLKLHRNNSESGFWNQKSENAKIKPLDGEVEQSASGAIYTQYWILTIATPLAEGDRLYPIGSQIKDRAGNGALPRKDKNALAFVLPAPDTTVPKAHKTQAISADGYGNGNAILLQFDDYVMMKGWTFDKSQLLILKFMATPETKAAPLYFDVSNSRTWNDASTGGTIAPYPGTIVLFDNTIYASAWTITLAGTTGLQAGDVLHPKMGQVVDRSGNVAEHTNSGSAAFTLPALPPASIY